MAGLIGPSLRFASPASLPILAGLADHLFTDAVHAKVPNTIKTYIGPWQRYVFWVKTVLPHLPSVYEVPPEITALFLTHVRLTAAARSHGPSPVLTASAAISCFHQMIGKPSPTEHSACGLVRDVAKRTLSATKMVRDPLSASDIRALVVTFCHPGASLLDRMHATVICIMFLGFLRYDDVAKVLVHEDLLLIHDSHVEFFLYKSKTDQHMEGHWVTLAQLPHSPCCPVRLLRALLAHGGYTQAAPAGWDVGPLLRACAPGARAGSYQLAQVRAPLTAPIPSLSASRLRQRMNELFSLIGVHKHLGNHSPRIGATSAAAALSVPDRLFQAAGRWKSAEVKNRYVREALAHRLAVSRNLGI